MSLVDAIPSTIKEIGRLKAKGIGASADYGQLIADLGQMVGKLPAQRRQEEDQKQQRIARQQQIQIQQQEMAQRQQQMDTAARKQGAQDALSSALYEALDPTTGQVDLPKLGAHLKGSPAMLEFPDLVDQFTVMQSHAARLKEQTIKNSSDLADHLGAMAAGADAFSDPKNKAGALLAGIASSVKQGILDQATAQPLVEEITGPDGEPDAAGTQSVIDRLRVSSQTQKQLDDKSRVADAQVQASLASRQATTDDKIQKDAEKRLQNYAAQLANATTRVGYEMVWHGIPDELKPLFDPPELFDPIKSSQRARFAGMSPKEQQDALNALADNTRGDAELRVRQRQEDRLGRTEGTEDDPKQRIVYGKWKDYVAQYQQAQSEQRQRVPPILDDLGQPHPGKAPAYIPPPSFEEWKAMPDEQRQRVLADPTTPRTQPKPAAMQSPAGADRNTEPRAAAAAQTVSEADLVKIAGLRGTTVQEQRARAIREGFTVVP